MDRSTQRDNSSARLLVVVLFASLIGAVRVWQSPATSEAVDSLQLTEQEAPTNTARVDLPVVSGPVPSQTENQPVVELTLPAPKVQNNDDQVSAFALSTSLSDQQNGDQQQVEIGESAASLLDKELADIGQPESQQDQAPDAQPAEVSALSHVPTEEIPLATLTPQPPKPNPQLSNLLPAYDRVTEANPSQRPNSDVLRALMDDASSSDSPPAPSVRKDPAVAGHQALNQLKVPAPVVSSTAISASWPEPKALISMLGQVRSRQASEWQRKVSSWITAIARTPVEDRGQLRVAIEQLNRLNRHTESLARQTQQHDRAEALAIRTTGYALMRRTQLWAAALEATSPSSVARCKSSCGQDHRAIMQAALNDTATALNRSRHKDAWYEFLSFKELAAVANSDAIQDRAAKLAIAGHILDRILDDDLSELQTRFLAQPALQRLTSALHVWSTVPVDTKALLTAVERLELSADPEASQQVAQFWRQLKYSSIPEHRHLADVIDQHYRNANVRFAATENFVNRLVPAIRNINAPVREMILGAQVHGQSASRTQFMVDLLPDDENIKVRLNGQGRMNARTQSSKGAITFHSTNRANVRFRKLFTLAPDSLRVGRTDATADGRTNILGLNTQYDAFPVVGSIVRRVAIQKQYESKNIARRVFEYKVANKARNRLDAQVDQQLQKAQRRFEEKILNPLETMELDPTALAMRSTNNRMEMRGRLAAEHQLGAYSARPRPLPNNMVDIQIHQSAINNFLDQVQLEGREGKLPDVFRSVAVDLGFVELKVPEEIPQDMHIKLATIEPIRVDCVDDRVKLTIRVDHIKGEALKLRDFEVVSYFAPEVDGIKCNLRRQGAVQVRCPRRNRLAVVAVFTKVLSKNRAIPMVYPEVAEHPKMKDLQLTQLVLRDGWVGLSVGQTPMQAAKQSPRMAGRQTRYR